MATQYDVEYTTQYDVEYTTWIRRYERWQSSTNHCALQRQLQAAPYERNEERQGYRNGYRPRRLTTLVGQRTLRVLQVRDGVFSTELFARYQRSEQALILTLMEMVVNGVSTRKVARITEELCGTSFAKSTVSDLCKGLDPLVQAWNDRDLSGQRSPFVLVDALVLKVREGGRVRAVSALVAVGVNEHGYREILGLQLGDSESERSWMAFFTTNIATLFPSICRSSPLSARKARSGASSISRPLGCPSHPL